MPKSAIAEIIPALNTDWSGTVETFGRPTKMIATPTTNIARTIVVLMSIGVRPSPVRSNDGRRSGNSPRSTIATTPAKKASAALRPCAV
jgi:hypothetical protein